MEYRSLELIVRRLVDRRLIKGVGRQIHRQFNKHVLLRLQVASVFVPKPRAGGRSLRCSEAWLIAREPTQRIPVR